jgi:histidinol dehydrogenase
MIPILHPNLESERRQVESLLDALRLNPKEVAVAQGPRAKEVAAVEKIHADVAARGDEAVVESARKFDDENFSAEQIRVTPQEMKSAAGRVVPG